jgi:hypothetical protein
LGKPVYHNVFLAGRLLERHREKAGTIEGGHDVLKNELAAGVMPTQILWDQFWVAASGHADV